MRPHSAEGAITVPALTSTFQSATLYVISHEGVESPGSHLPHRPACTSPASHQCCATSLPLSLSLSLSLSTDAFPQPQQGNFNPQAVQHFHNLKKEMLTSKLFKSYPVVVVQARPKKSNIKVKTSIQSLVP